MKPPYLKINHADIHLLIDILDELEEKTTEECELQAKLEEIYRRMKDARNKKRISNVTTTEVKTLHYGVFCPNGTDSHHQEI